MNKRFFKIGENRRRKKALSIDDVKKVKKRIDNGETKAEVARDFGISRYTVYRYLKGEA
ncbi:MAG: helix-turn-helix domain-containing protein [Calditrichia bacterium]